MNSASVIDLSAREAKLKRKVRAHLKKLGFVKGSDGLLALPGLDKQSYRDAHADQRKTILTKNRRWIEANSEGLISHFAHGSNLDVEKIRPVLIPVCSGTWQGDLFRFATYYWRIPVSEGYGRRMRFLVWDEHHEKLIGIFALGDAVFNLRSRDELIGWTQDRKKDALVNLMDAYVLGAVPPYNMLLGGKLVASLIRSSEVVSEFESRYLKTVGLISNKPKRAKLVAVTTTSALGRSSIYNRLKLDNKMIFRPIGTTLGWGHFHFSDSLFGELRDFLRYIGDPYADSHGYGQGPNFRLRVIKRALYKLGLDSSMAKHGLTREVFFSQFASNCFEYLRGDHKRARYLDLPSVEEIGSRALSRWVIPRSQRMQDYKQWDPLEFLADIYASTGITLPRENLEAKPCSGR